MGLTYAVRQGPEGWAVYENDEALVLACVKRDAVEIAYQLAVDVRMAGGSAVLLVQGELGFEPLDVDGSPRASKRFYRGPEEAILEASQ